MTDDEFFYMQKIEDNFCRNFTCCGKSLTDLHELLNHYEESHVKLCPYKQPNTTEESLINNIPQDDTDKKLSNPYTDFTFQQNTTQHYLQTPISTDKNYKDIGHSFESSMFSFDPTHSLETNTGNCGVAHSDIVLDQNNSVLQAKKGIDTTNYSHLWNRLDDDKEFGSESMFFVNDVEMLNIFNDDIHPSVHNTINPNNLFIRNSALNRRCISYENRILSSKLKKCTITTNQTKKRSNKLPLSDRKQVNIQNTHLSKDANKNLSITHQINKNSPKKTKAYNNVISLYNKPILKKAGTSPIIEKSPLSVFDLHNSPLSVDEEALAGFSSDYSFTTIGKNLTENSMFDTVYNIQKGNLRQPIKPKTGRKSYTNLTVENKCTTSMNYSKKEDPEYDDLNCNVDLTNTDPFENVSLKGLNKDIFCSSNSSESVNLDKKRNLWDIIETDGSNLSIYSDEKSAENINNLPTESSNNKSRGFSNSKSVDALNLKRSFAASTALYDDNLILDLINSNNPIFIVNNNENQTSGKPLHDLKRKQNILKYDRSMSIDNKSFIDLKTRKEILDGLFRNSDIGLEGIITGDTNELGDTQEQTILKSPVEKIKKRSKKTFSSTPNLLGLKGISNSRESMNADSGMVERPYLCEVSGCNRSYKNSNGLKYHMMHGHNEDTMADSLKPYKCLVPNCYRAYKNLNGLKLNMMKLLAIFTVIAYVLVSVTGLQYTLQSMPMGNNPSKCISTWIPKDLPVKVRVKSTPNMDGQVIGVNIFDDSANNNKYAQQTGISDQTFTFHTQAHSNVIVCVDNILAQGIQRTNQQSEILLKIDAGSNVDDYRKMILNSELTPIEAELKRLESNLEDVQDFLGYLQTREYQLRDMSEAANARVSTFSLLTVGVLVGIAIWQVFYLRRFFHAKKLI
ncbi:hypothetical protein BB559_004626 [Furculomyces boomerangus]|uniref:C2H2-type domain-containing protein n=1 Tax=Furculomyces boomerangus TaxID=61424 RepID=A0A2T9YDM3_9FUNG|nr:hypothetical protein BB559_004626 [Furculomyces boomerangus]